MTGREGRERESEREGSQSATRRHRRDAKERERERSANVGERKYAVESNERASRSMSFRLHDGVDALEARRACGGSFSSRSYADRKTLRVTSPLRRAARHRRRGIVGGPATPRSFSVLSLSLSLFLFPFLFFLSLTLFPVFGSPRAS